MTVSTYHCLCSELLLASTTTPLKDLPRRQGDGSYICKSSGTHLTASVEVEAKPVVLKLEDGFEKRYLLRCGRCGVTVGYGLDLSQFEATKAKIGREDDVVYLLEGGLLETEEMEKGEKQD